MVKNNAKIASLIYLEKFKVKHSKMKNVEYKSLEIQNYLTSTSIYPQLAKESFKWRTRMVQFKKNFPNGSDDYQCPLGCPDEDSQEKIFSCSALMQYFPEFTPSKLNYFDLFSNSPIKIKNITSILEKIFKKREALIQQKNLKQQNVLEDSKK